MVVFMFHSETWQKCKTVLKSQFATSLIDPGRCHGLVLVLVLVRVSRDGRGGGGAGVFKFRSVSE